MTPHEATIRLRAARTNLTAARRGRLPIGPTITAAIHLIDQALDAEDDREPEPPEPREQPVPPTAQRPHHHQGTPPRPPR